MRPAEQSLPELVPPGFTCGIEILNNNTTPMRFVADVRISAVGMDPKRANETMLEIHGRGGVLLPTASRPEAERLAAQITAEAKKQAYPLLYRPVEKPA
jgi:ATP-dependent Clp protease adapter protein ClpS